MPRFSFQTHDGKEIPDDLGHELCDARAARHYALQLAGSLIAEVSPQQVEQNDWKMDVCDERGLILFSYALVAIDGASMSGSRTP